VIHPDGGDQIDHFPFFTSAGVSFVFGVH
jgi:hypothetical protein